MKYLFTGLWQSLRASARRRRSLAILASCMLASCVAMAAVVSMHPPSGGGELRIPVMLYGDSEEYVSGLQFDLDYDPTQFELVSVSAGNVATEAGKEVILSETVSGRGRVLITGFNDNGMTDGQVATVTLRPLTGDSPQHDITLGHVLASDPDGNRVPIDYADLFQYPPAPPVESEEILDPDTGVTDVAPETSETFHDDTATGESPQKENQPEPDNENTGVAPAPLGGGFSGSGGSFGGNTRPQRGETTGTTAEAARAGTSRNRQYISGAEGYTMRAGNPARTQSAGGRAGNDVQSNSLSERVISGASGKAADGARNGLNGQETARRDLTPGETPPASRLALARPASGLTDPPDADSMSYSLALESPEENPEAAHTRVAAIALAIVPLVSILALYHLLFGRRARPAWRKTR